MGKLNPLVKPTSKLDTERLAGGSGALAAKQSNVALLKQKKKAISLITGSLFFLCTFM